MSVVVVVSPHGRCSCRVIHGRPSAPKRPPGRRTLCSGVRSDVPVAPSESCLGKVPRDDLASAKEAAVERADGRVRADDAGKVDKDDDGVLRPRRPR